MALSLAVATIGLLTAFATYKWKKINADAIADRFPRLHRFLLNKWYFDELYGGMVVGGTLLLTRVLRWVDNTIVDGLVNGSASWTRGIVFGYSNHWKEKPLNSRVFLVLGMIAAAVVAVAGFQWLVPGERTVSGILVSGLGALGAGLLTFFFFWSGAGGFDKYVVDGLVNGVASSSGFFGLVFKKVQTGRVQTYLVFVLLGVMVFFFIFKSM